MEEINKLKDKYFLMIKELANKNLDLDYEKSKEDSDHDKIFNWIDIIISTFRDNKIISESEIYILDEQIINTVLECRHEKMRAFSTKEEIKKIVMDFAYKNLSWKL